MEKRKKAKIPTILIGLGGIGCWIANEVDSMLDEETKEYVGVVGMDTNENDLRKLKIKTIQTSDDNKVNYFLRRYPELVKWFPVNKFTVNRDMKNGAGQIRAISRLAALAAEKAGKFVVLDEEVKRVLKHAPGKATGEVNVFFVGSITGGSAGGMFLQLPFYVKRFLKNEAAIENVRIRGMFLSADLTKNVQPSEINKQAVMVNAYACMKELNAFYLTQILEDEELDLELDYYTRKNIKEEAQNMKNAILEGQFGEGLDDFFADEFDLSSVENDAKAIVSDGANIPYHAFYLIEGMDNEGGVGNVSLDTIKKQVAKMIYIMLFSPVKAEAESTEDNLILQEMEGGGMNRYSSAGLCCLVYPYEVVREYVTLRWVQDLVKEEWLFIDKAYESELDIAYSEQKTNPAVKLPKLEDSYIRLFKKEVSGGEGSHLGHLREEVYIENPDDYNAPISKTSKLLRRVEAEVDAILDQEEVSSCKEECKINMKLLGNLDTADGEIKRVYDALEELERKVKSVITEYRSQIANDVFPTKASSLEAKKDSSLCIYNLFVGVHPIAARFLCYDMMNMLDKKIAVLETNITSADLSGYENIDFYGTEKDGIQDASEAVIYIKNKKIPILPNDKRPLHVLASKFQHMTSNQISLLENYGKDSLLLGTYTILKERFRTLAQYYSEFFSNIEKEIRDNEERLERLENAYVHPTYGEIPVYASPEAFRMIYQDFRLKADFVLPEETKKAVFEKVYQISAAMLENKKKEMTEELKRIQEEENHRKLLEIFDVGIVDSLKTLVISKGRGIVDMTIKQAVAKELSLKKGMLDMDDPSFEAKRVEYESKLIYEAMSTASPMFATENKPDFTETIYMGIHPAAAEFSGKEADKAATKDRLVPEQTAETDHKPVCVLMEEEFSPYEIICFKAKHKYLIEDLVKYRKGSEFANAYEKRIRNLGKEPTEEGVDAYKTVVNPHLNRFWHEEGMIPEIGAQNRAKAEKETLKAFVYAMGMNLLQRSHNEDYDNRLLWHYVIGSRMIPVRKKGVLIGNAYVDVYQALSYNRKIRNNILYNANIMKRNTKGYMDAEEMREKVGTTWFIEDLIQSKGDPEEENFLDILIKMFPMMPRKKWEKLFKGLSYTLEDYLNDMFDQNTKMMKAAYDEILNQMMAYSQIGKKHRVGEELTHAEKKAEGQVLDLIRGGFL